MAPMGNGYAAFIPVGRTFDPDTGESWEGTGVKPDVAVPADKALDEALKLAERLAAMAPNAVASAKDLLRQAAGADLTRQLQAERDQFMTNLVHPNAEEGLQAFFDKRSPRFH
jgi:enoyl-CoA hydratase/carnithine racemase